MKKYFLFLLIILGTQVLCAQDELPPLNFSTLSLKLEIKAAQSKIFHSISILDTGKQLFKNREITFKTEIPSAYKIIGLKKSNLIYDQLIVVVQSRENPKVIEFISFIITYDGVLIQI